MPTGGLRTGKLLVRKRFVPPTRKPYVKKGRQYPPFELVKTEFERYGLPREDVDVTRLNKAIESTNASNGHKLQHMGSCMRMFRKMGNEGEVMAQGGVSADGYSWFAIMRFEHDHDGKSVGSRVIVAIPWQTRRNHKQAGTRLDRSAAVYAIRGGASSKQLQDVVDALVEALERYPEVG